MAEYQKSAFLEPMGILMDSVQYVSRSSLVYLVTADASISGMFFIFIPLIFCDAVFVAGVDWFLCNGRLFHLDLGVRVFDFPGEASEIDP